MIPSLKNQWEMFAERSDLMNAPDHQRYEMNYAFICGAASVLVTMRNEVSQLSEENGVAVFEAWMKEFGIFIHDRVRRFNMMQQVNNNARKDN